MSNKRESVKVIVRCRPLSDKEIAAGFAQVIDVDSKLRKIRIRPEKDIPGEKEFTFDATYNTACTQEDIYRESVLPLVEAVLQGFNGTIFAYGQTGTGKTFTMQGSKQHPGIIPRAMEGVFQHIDRSTNEHYLVTASYLEIYQEDIRDLLATKDKDNPEKKIEIKEKPNGEIYIKNLSTYQLKSLRHMEKMMERGQSNRAVGSTDMNAESSRSHAIFIVNIECGQVGLDGKEHIRVGKLNLVDLAGSEKQSKTNSTGDRFKEATQINLSLSTLGQVITALVDKASHVPYRDSKLTRLLQDSLGGNSKTIMVANIGPAMYNLEETMSTLRYAHRAKNIKNAPHINEDPKDAKMREYLDELTALKAKLSNRSPMGSQSTTAKPTGTEEDDSDGEQYAQEQAKIAQERASLLENNGLNEEEKEKLTKEMNIKESSLRKREAERQELKSKIDTIEQRMLRGTGTANVHERMSLQKETLQKTRTELDQQKKREEAILVALQREQEDAQEANATVSIVQSDIDNIQTRINKLLQHVNSLQNDLQAEEDIAQNFNEDVGDQLEILRQKEALMWTMVTHFIGPTSWEPLLEKAVYDEKRQDWQLPSETSDITRPPLFIDIPTYRQEEIRDIYGLLLPDNLLDVELDLSESSPCDKPLHDPDGEDAVVADLLAEALDNAGMEEDLVIDADVFTIERPALRPSSRLLDYEKENNYGRRSSTPTKALRGSPDLTFPTSRGWIK